MNKAIWFCWVVLTIVLAMALRIAPWSSSLELWNPDWVLLTLMYWSVAIPDRVGIFFAWTVGILTDELTGQLFGQHALTYSLIIYACLKLHKRLRRYPLLQQGAFIFVCLLFSQLLFFFLKNLQHSLPMTNDFWLPIITGAVCWPLVFKLLHTIPLSK
jgi:rod shape-determining protein MreD